MAGRPLFATGELSQTSTGPMPAEGLPDASQGMPSFQGGAHPATGSLFTADAVVPTEVRVSPRLIDPRTRGATTFARSLYRPHYWREWTEEAAEATQVALKELQAKDAKNQRYRMRKERRRPHAFAAATSRGVRTGRKPTFGLGPRIWEPKQTYHSVQYETNVKPAPKLPGGTMGLREDVAKVHISHEHTQRLALGPGPTVSAQSYKLPGGFGKTELESTARNAPAYSLGGGMTRAQQMTRLSETTGPGPAYKPKETIGSGPSAPFAFRHGPSFGNAADVGPGPGYDTRPRMDGPAFSMGTSVRDPKSKPPPPASAGRAPGPTPAGFGYGCSLEEHITYGQCLDGRCSSRANWESVASRQTKANATLKRRTRRQQRKREASLRASQSAPSLTQQGSASLSFGASLVSDDASLTAEGDTSGALLGAGPPPAPTKTLPSSPGPGPGPSTGASGGAGGGVGAGGGDAPGASTTVRFQDSTALLDQDSAPDSLHFSQFQSLLEYSQAPSALKGSPRYKNIGTGAAAAPDARSDAGSSCAFEDPEPDPFAPPPMVSTGASASEFEGEDGSPVQRIPADSEAPYPCFPMHCVHCRNVVPLKSPVRRVRHANKHALTEFRGLLESTKGRPNTKLLATTRPKAGNRASSMGRSRTFGASLSMGSAGGSTMMGASSSMSGFFKPPVLFMPGCGYFCAEPCLKTYILSMASPDIAKVEKGRNTRRVALLAATERKELDIISSLLVSGAHINVQDPTGRTPLHLACAGGDPNVVDRLLHGAFNVLTYTQCTAHHHSRCRCFNQKPNFDKKDDRGYTPLHSAAKAGNVGIVEKLIAAGADSQAEDKNGHAPQDVAKNQACFAVLRMSSRVVQDRDRLRTMTLRTEDLIRTMNGTNLRGRSPQPGNRGTGRRGVHPQMSSLYTDPSGSMTLPSS